MFINDHASGVYVPGGLSDLSYGVSPNEHARVDILTAGASAFDTGAGVVLNLYDTASLAGTTTNPWVHYSFDITSAVGGGGTFQIRFAEVDNQSNMELGVDNVSITETTAVPAPSSLALLGIGIATFAGYFSWRRKQFVTA